MTSLVRVPGKHGRRAPKNTPALRFADIRTGAPIPSHPAAEDYLASLNNWQVLGNDRAGDCVAVTFANMRRLVTSFLAVEHYPSQQDVWAVYETQNPTFDPNGTASTNGPGSPEDQGMDIQTLLEHLVLDGGPDGVKALAFAKVDYANAEELDAALAIFGGVWLGVNLTQANMDQFGSGADWDYVADSPVDGGHSVLAGGYGQDVRLITWGAETGMTSAFQAHQVEEAWVVVWPEHAGTKSFEQGVDGAALSAAYQDLTGKTLVLSPVPDPTPPSPRPEPDTADLALVATLGPWSREHHIGGNETAARAFTAWAKTKGYA